MTNYYNDNDPYAAQWLRNLIAARLIPDGIVDESSIVDVNPKYLLGFTQCHFFAGIGGWSLALELAGWPADVRVWTGSCPCQPFSAIGKGKGLEDERHLWPYFAALIEECRPPIVFGEQVASKDAEPWLDVVSDDLEAMGFAFGALAFPSASVGAPHIRDRTYWMGYADNARLEGLRRGHSTTQRHGQATLRSVAPPGKLVPGQQTPTNGFWRNADWIECRDSNWRPVEPGTFPLADGVSERVGKLRAYGNAINPHQAAEFIKVAMEFAP